MAREQLSKFNVVACYPDMEAARNAFNALEAAGVDGDDMSLLGRHAEEAAAELETRQRDAHLVGDVGEHVAKGGAVGSVAGGISSIDQSEDWELTYDEVAEGKVLVATHADDEADAEKQESVLRQHRPLKVERFDEKGRRIGN